MSTSLCDEEDMSFEDIIEDSFQFDDDGDERGSEDDEEVSLKLMPGPH